MSKELSSFARRMREARVQKGIKQNQLADEIGLTPQTISLYEKATEGGKALGKLQEILSFCAIIARM